MPHVWSVGVQHCPQSTVDTEQRELRNCTENTKTTSYNLLISLTTDKKAWSCLGNWPVCVWLSSSHNVLYLCLSSITMFHNNRQKATFTATSLCLLLCIWINEKTVNSLWPGLSGSSLSPVCLAEWPCPPPREPFHGATPLSPCQV